MTKQTKIKHYTKRDYAAFAYLAPWIIGMLVLQLYPFLSSLVYSFCNYKITGTPSFTGLSNYIQLFTMDNEFWNSLKVTLAYTLYTVPGKLVMALAVAVFLNRDIKGINLIRTLYYIPSLFGGSVAVALLWKIMFMDNGVINAILTTLHLPNVQWLGDPNQALRTICMMEIWQFGSSMVMFLAALKTFRQICTKLPRLTAQARSRCSSASPFRKSPPSSSSTLLCRPFRLCRTSPLPLSSPMAAP